MAPASCFCTLEIMNTRHTQSLAARIERAFATEHDERPAVIAGSAMFFFLFAGYFMLRPVRETMGIAGGVDKLQWLFTATFLATLAALPLFGWIASKVPRRQILPCTYAFFVTNLASFALLFATDPDNVWNARAFYVWLSVFNLLAISLAWSVLADVFDVAQGRRLFALMAAGASLGGLTGPILGTLLVKPIGHAGLLALSALLITASGFAASYLHRWRDRQRKAIATAEPRDIELGGSMYAGAAAVWRSPYLLAIGLFVVLLAVVSTFLYFEQARIVAATFKDKTQQTEVFGMIDTAVQAMTIFIQLFLTGRIAERFGMRALLAAVPMIMVLGFLWLALAPVFAALAAVMIVRRVGEYAFVRPGREMLYLPLSAEEKYKAKNFIDTAVYRGGDALGGWVKTALDAFAQQPAMVMIFGALVAAGWGLTGIYLANRQETTEQAEAAATR